MAKADYETIKANAIARLTAATESPKPSYNVNGRLFNWMEYQQYLQGLIDWADGKISEEDGPCFSENFIP